MSPVEEYRAMTAITESTTQPAATESVVGKENRGVSASRRSWSPYAVGTGIGVLSWLAFAIVDKPLGVSTSLSAASGACVIPFVGADDVAQNAYWAKHMPKWDYGMLFIVGTFLGALVS